MIRWTTRSGICELELRREPCNEIGSQMLRELEGFLRELDLRGVRALIVHSSRRRGFCAGADLRELASVMRAHPTGREARTAAQRLANRALRSAGLRRFIDRVHAVMDALDTLPIVTLGAVHGVCFGGGFELALTCDLLIAERSARFCFPELRLGIIPGFGGIPRLKRALPNPVIRDMLLTGRSINAKRAAELGLVSQAVAPGQALAVAREVAHQITHFERSAVSEAKAFIKPLPQKELRQERALFLRMCQGPWLEQALRRFEQSSDRMPYLPQGM
ncbi:MAG: enoyl-CoA hydratase/isomerase family protein [Proteobacteria bacterium]|nr:enoyl-CoA hydratase/isomerase family protein [Pseudomonadota bacterium]